MAEIIYRSIFGNTIIRVVGGLCLEIYLVQGFLISAISDNMNSLFPLNIILMFLIIVIVAYLTRCLARLLLQSFREAPYNWKNIISIY